MIFGAGDVFHDLKSKHYHVAGLTNEERGSGDFYDTLPPSSYFSPGALRARIKR